MSISFQLWFSKRFSPKGHMVISGDICGHFIRSCMVLKQVPYLLSGYQIQQVSGYQVPTTWVPDTISPLPTIWECSFIVFHFLLKFRKGDLESSYSFSLEYFFCHTFFLLNIEMTRKRKEKVSNSACMLQLFFSFFLDKDERLRGQSVEVSEKVKILIHSRYLLGF